MCRKYVCKLICLLNCFCCLAAVVDISSENGQSYLDFYVLENQNLRGLDGEIERSTKDQTSQDSWLCKNYENYGQESNIPDDSLPKNRFTIKGVIRRKLPVNDSFCDQLNEVLNSIRLTRETVEKTSKLYEDLDNVLQENWPGSTVIPFGSITYGLAIQGSDVDCYVKLPASFDLRNTTKYVVQAAKTFEKYSKIFNDMRTKLNSPVPTVKANHIPSGFSADINFKTYLGVRSSKLIGFLLRLDPRLIPFHLLIKYSFKLHEFTGQGKLSGYALTLLMIFYLQQGTEPILPPIEYLQRDKKFDFYVDDWNTGFDYTYKHKTRNNKSVKELFLGFVKYYVEFDFKKHTVSTFIGRPIETKAFLTPENLPNALRLYVDRNFETDKFPFTVSNSMNVQDIFALNSNKANTVDDVTVEKVKRYFRWILQISERENVNKSRNNQFLRRILLREDIAYVHDP